MAGKNEGGQGEWQKHQHKSEADPCHLHPISAWVGVLK